MACPPGTVLISPIVSWLYAILLLPKEAHMHPYQTTDAMQVSRRSLGWLVLGVVVGSCLSVFGTPTAATAADDVKIAVIVPLSGRWARQGELYKAGSEMAVDEI